MATCVLLKLRVAHNFRKDGFVGGNLCIRAKICSCEFTRIRNFRGKAKNRNGQNWENSQSKNENPSEFQRDQNAGFVKVTKTLRNWPDTVVPLSIRPDSSPLFPNNRKIEILPKCVKQNLKTYKIEHQQRFKINFTYLHSYDHFLPKCFAISS